MAVLTVTNPPRGGGSPRLLRPGTARRSYWATGRPRLRRRHHLGLRGSGNAARRRLTPAWQGSGTTATVPTVPSGVFPLHADGGLRRLGTNDLNLSDEMVITAAAPIDADRLVPRSPARSGRSPTVETIQEDAAPRAPGASLMIGPGRTIGAAVETKVTEIRRAVAGAHTPLSIPSRPGWRRRQRDHRQATARRRGRYLATRLTA